MINKHFSIVLGVISTILFLVLLPHLLQDFFREDATIWKRLNYLVIPLIVVIMWRQILKLLRDGNTQHSNNPENNSAEV